MALRFGQQKINLHERGHEFEPKAHLPVPGALDLCFIADRPLEQVIDRLALRLADRRGPVERTGATQTILSVYVRDPDLNLIEISQPLSPDNHARRQSMKRLSLAIALATAAAAFLAQGYPNKPSRWSCPFAAGGPTDVVPARSPRP